MSRAGSRAPSRRFDLIVRKLKAKRSRLRALGVKHLSTFGSYVRGTARRDSDVDLLVDLDRRMVKDILDYAGIAAELNRLLPVPVDVMRRDRLPAKIAAVARHEEVHAFWHDRQRR